MTAVRAAALAPQTVLFAKFDTLGDLVLFAPTLQAVRDAWPKTRLVVLMRRAYADLAPLLVAGVEWISTTLDPFAQGPEADSAEVARIRDAVAALKADVVVAATSRRNWLETLVAASSGAARRIAIGAASDDEFFATQLRVKLEIDAASAFTEHVAAPMDEPDWRRNFVLADALLAPSPASVGPGLRSPPSAPPVGSGLRSRPSDLPVGSGLRSRPSDQAPSGVGALPPDHTREAPSGVGALPQISRVAPSLTLPAAVLASATPILQRHGLTRGEYVVCAAAGFANVALKTWPADRFGAVLAHLQQRHGRRTLLVGHAGERAHLDTVAAAANGAATVWTGGTGELPHLAALIAQAALFVGNDTGAMHLAAALHVPVVAVFGGGTWPRFVPAARRSVSVVHPLPCFGCGWDCAFGDAPCIGEIRVTDVTEAVDSMLRPALPVDLSQIRAVEHLPESTRAVMGKAAARYHEARRDHLARQHKLEELTELDREKDAAIHEKEAAIAEKEAAIFKAEADMKTKDAAITEKENEINAKQAEIDSLRVVCNEREQLIITMDRNVRALQTQAQTVAADKALLEKTLADLPPDREHAVKTIAGQASHIRNLEALVQIRNQELTEARATAANRTAGLHDLEQAKHYGKLLGEKEAVIRDLHRTCQAREAVIRQLMAETTGFGAKLWKLWHALKSWSHEKIGRPLGQWWFNTVVEHYWMQIGSLRQHDPKPLRWDNRLPGPRLADAALPQLAVVTPSYGQEKFIERTMLSVLDQHYPKLKYVVQDGGSKDRSAEIIARYAGRLRHWESVKDNGQADAIGRGFAHIAGELAPDDLMAWLNSDDLLGPGVLRYVAEYFARHPDVDVIYGHRIIIDDDDCDVGRWIMPPHDPRTLEWVDYVPQETMFWRKKAWDLVGGIDPTFQFALDWDLLARFQQAGCRMVRVPYFLGAFRVHNEQKTSQAIHTVGAEEMRRIRTRFHGERQDDPQTIEQFVRKTRFAGAITARLLALGIRR